MFFESRGLQMTQSNAAGMKRRDLLASVLAGRAALAGVPLMLWDASANAQQAAADLDPKGILRIGIDYDPITWDPHRMGSTRDQDYLFPVYDRLVHLMPNGQYRPSLAESWKPSPDGLKFDFKLRRGVKFHDGSNFDANVVKANIERAKTLPVSTVKGDLVEVASVEVLDPYTVRFHLSRPNSMLPVRLSGRPGAMISPLGLNSPDLHTKPAGSGMFKLVSHVRGSKATYERWSGYWSPQTVKLAGLEIRFMQDAARVNALLAKEIDLGMVPATEIERVVAAGYRMDTDAAYDFNYLLMNWAKPPFDNPKVRQAVQYALDRKAFVDAIEGGRGRTSLQVASPKTPEYDKSLENLYTYDPKRARQLIEESGAKDLTLNFIMFQGNDYNQRLNQMAQAQMEAVGFKVNLRAVDRAQAPTLLFGGGVHGMVGPAGVLPSTLLGLDWWFASSGRLNMAKQASKEMDEAIQKAFAATTPAEATRWATRANRIAVESSYNAMLYFTVSPLATSPRVVGYKKAPVGFMEFYDVGIRRA